MDEDIEKLREKILGNLRPFINWRRPEDDKIALALKAAAAKLTAEGRPFFLNEREEDSTGKVPNEGPSRNPKDI